MVDYIYQMALNLLKHSIFGVKTSIFYRKYATLLWARFHNVTRTRKRCLSILMHGVISLPGATSYDTEFYYLRYRSPRIEMRQFIKL